MPGYGVQYPLRLPTFPRLRASRAAELPPMPLSRLWKRPLGCPDYESTRASAAADEAFGICGIEFDQPHIGILRLAPVKVFLKFVGVFR